MFMFADMKSSLPAAFHGEEIVDRRTGYAGPVGEFISPIMLIDGFEIFGEIHNHFISTKKISPQVKILLADTKILE